MDGGLVRILLIEDDPGDARLIEALLSEADFEGAAFRFDWIETYEAGKAAIARQEHDVCLVDYRLGMHDGVELLRAATDDANPTPIIMLTGQDDHDLDVEAMKAGAADYLVKDQLNAAELERAIRYTLERRRLVKALDRERYLLHALMDTLPDSIYFKDASGRFIRVSKSLANRLDLDDPRDALGRTDGDFFSSQYAEQARIDERQLMESGQTLVDKEEQPTWPDGSNSWVSTTKVPLKDKDQRIVGTFGISRDITERKQAAAALEEAKDAAEEASRAKSAFLANMSHEIRTPMNAVIGMTELVLDTNLTSTQRDYLMLVLDSGEYLMSVINDIMDFSKIEAGKLDLDHAPFDFRNNLGDTMQLLALRAHRKGLELAYHIESDLPEFLVGDGGRLRQIILNLIGNGIKFTNEGEVLLDVHCQSRTPDELILHFEVKDTGIGIPDEKLVHIFDAFEQADTSMTRRFEGTGLGLAISTRLVELMGGRLWVESQVGQGSTFHVTLPFGVTDQVSVPVRIPDLYGLRVLVVDDNATNRKILEEVLRNWEMKPTVVAGAPEALEVMQRARESGESFSLVLSDVNMPDMDGFAFADHIQEDQDTAGTVIMMLTSGDRLGDAAKCEELGIAAHLIKPVKQSELLAAIVASLGIEVSSVEELEAESAIYANQLGSLRILVAEDSPANQKLAVALLEKWGHSATIVTTGKEALEAVESQQFDLVLMDVQMPEMDGLEATAAIRRRERGTSKHIPIIAMTAHAMKGDREGCLESGMDGYVAKPVRIKQLYQAIAGIILDGNTPVNSLLNSTSSDTVIIESSEMVDLDWEAALENVQGDRELLASVAEAFLEECPLRLKEIDDALHNVDSESLCRAAHTIKGATRIFRAATAVELAARLEATARQGELGNCGELIDALKLEMKKVTEAIADFVNYPAAD